ncbi:MAG TPA: TonB-dependent receptor [Saprospiraceae bacterium]|nr:TonB-dependent receptor [Saprospiraceae bacterium]
MGSTLHANLTPYPPGAFGGIFTAGVQERFRFRVNQERAELNALYQGMRNHRLRMGIGTTLAEVSDVNEKRNFIIGLTGRPRPLSRLTDIDSLDLEPFLSEKQRTVEYAFLQDEWRFAPDWTLTTGGRFDHYSDFGSTFNPRLSLVWNLSPSLTSKLLYGRSFRAPSFTELYGNSQLALVGDPHLKPETLDMIQFVLAKQWGRALSTSINLFWYHLNDQIRGEVNPATPASPVQVVNGVGLNGHGLEFETQYRLTERISLSGNYAYQRAEDKQYHESPGQAPEHQIYGELNWQLTPDWALNSHLKWIGARQRPPGYQGQADAYTLVGITLRRFDSQNRWEAALSINNLLNADAREPSFYPASLPYDIPLAGRNLIGQLKVRF